MPPWGVNGGHPAQRSRKVLVRTDGSREVVPAKCDRIQVAPGDLLHFITWGGAGWGDPLERDPHLVAADVRRGLVTSEGAQSHYGIVITAENQVDDEATTAKRAELRSRRDELPIFNFGPSVDELRQKCQEETGLEPPRQPVFNQLAEPMHR